MTGAVAAWGLVQVHLDGFRAEHAQITALVGGPGRTDLAAIATRYHAPVVPRAFLEPEAMRHGQHITPESVVSCAEGPRSNLGDEQDLEIAAGSPRIHRGRGVPRRPPPARVSHAALRSSP